MGISNFHTWLKDTYKHCFVSCRKKSKFDYIYIDVNHLLHHSVCGISNEKDFVKKLYKYLDFLFSNFIATTKIILAVDGTSPYSKIILQRKRRLQGIKKVDVTKINSLYLTPGTEFMDNINGHLENYIKRLKNVYKFLNVEYVVSPTTEPDEGEIKIFNKMLEYGKDKSKTHLVIGNDADLIVLAMAVKPIYNIHILIKHKRDVELLSIKKLINVFSNKLSKNIYLRNSWRSDFVVVSILMGNDYLPKLNYVKFESLWKSYYKTVKSLKKSFINNNTFDKEFTNQFLTTIISNIPKQYRTFNLEEYDEKKVENYLEGLLWCLNMYQTGKCSMYDYVYKYKSSPNPTDVLNYIQSNVLNVKIPTSKTPPINSNMYTLLLIPKKARTLIPDKYQNLIDNQLKYIYEFEECETCDKLKTELSELHKLIKNDEDVAKAKVDMGKVHSELFFHKKDHENEFSVNDIQKIVNLANF